MKKFLFLGIGSALMFTMGGVGPAQADNGPHVSTAALAVTSTNTAVGTDGCAACHRVHTAKSASGMLLKTTTQEELCYTCHGNGGSGAGTNVQGGVGYGDIAGALRGGGFENAMIGTDKGTAQYVIKPGSTKISPVMQSIPTLTTGTEASSSNHSIDGTAQTIWGNGAITNVANPGTANVKLECASCHDPHGNNNYRILRPVPNAAGTQVPRLLVTAHLVVPEVLDNADTTWVNEAMPEIPAVTADVMSSASGIAIPDQPDKVYTTTDYWQTVAPGVPATVSGVPVASPDGFIANISDWCLTCHTRYEGKSGARSADSGDAIYMYRHTTAKIDVNGTRNCITCHVAHGSNATVSGAAARVEMPGGAQPTVDQIGDSRLLRLDGRGVCLMCHNK